VLAAALWQWRRPGRCTGVEAALAVGAELPSGAYERSASS